MSPAVQSFYDSSANLSRGDGLESDDDVPETDQQKDLFPQLYESVVGDDTHQPSEDLARPKRNRKSRSNEFFVMMFRNYPILAKGVSMCRSCAAQLEPNATTESHASSCTGSAVADVRRSTLFRCTHCTATFWRAKDCRTHQLESCLPAHGVKIERLTEPSVACPMCDVRSYNRSGLMSHMKFRHSLDTDGVRQVMDRCGIRKSVPPTADNIITATSSPQQYEDGSLLMDMMSRDGMMPVSLTDTTQSPTTTADMLVDGESAGCDDGVGTWRTPGAVVQRTSTDVCNSVNNWRYICNTCLFTIDSVAPVTRPCRSSNATMSLPSCLSHNTHISSVQQCHSCDVTPSRLWCNSVQCDSVTQWHKWQLSFLS